LPNYNPVPISRTKPSFGFGDRLGRGTYGHIKALEGSSAFPVIAQQSMRELKLTGRTYEIVLEDAIWGAFQAGYRGYFAADGDHLKSKQEVIQAISAGYSMITIDCSQKLHPEILRESNYDKIQVYLAYPNAIRKRVESIYLDKELPFGKITQVDLAESFIMYSDAIQFIIEIYYDCLSSNPNISLEISIDETDAPTTAFAHFFIASELMQYNGVEVDSIAPRFVGEFQKGIDYIGNIENFESNLSLHHSISQLFGTKISVHSGSDKFSIFPSVSKITNNKFHIKTSGTSWVEFMRLVAMRNPSLFKDLYNYCLANLDEAKKNYHVSVTRSSCPSLEEILEDKYASSMDNNDIRQLFHINYGNILQHQEKSGASYKDHIFDILNNEESTYKDILVDHFNKHLNALKLK